MAKTKKQVVQKWEDYVKNLRKANPVPKETEKEKAQRIRRLEKDWVAFSKYHFANYCTAEFADFQKKFGNKVINQDNIYAVAAWAREHAKSVILGVLIPLYLKFTGRLHNMLVVSYNKDNAIELLMPIILNLENNPRLIADYGTQKGYRHWEASSGKVITKDGCSFRAIGARQSPRGSRNEEKRPDFILIDDIDTDEEGNNQKRIEKKWKWIEKALWPCMSITGTKRFVFAGNIISKESCIVKAISMSDFHQKINILDKKGKPSWHQRYTLKDINYVLSRVSYASGQSEYFNNPITEGSVFKDLKFGAVPKIDTFKFLVNYGDPSPSNKDNKNNSYKVVVQVGAKNGTYYIVDVKLEHVTNFKYIEWYHDISQVVSGTIPLYNYMENNSLQDPFYEQVYQPLMVQVNKKKAKPIYILPDERKKPDKFTRIEGTMEPLHRFGKLIFNIKQKDNPHMKRLIEQFEAVEPTLSAPVDGPDAVEGAIWVIDNKLKVMAPIKVGKHKRSKYKY